MPPEVAMPLTSSDVVEMSDVNRLVLSYDKPWYTPCYRVLKQPQGLYA